jgi:hypothetical protein
VGWLKRNLPLGLLVGLDALFQYSGSLWQLTPSVFLRAQAGEAGQRAEAGNFFKCPGCGAALPSAANDVLHCGQCGKQWGIENGIYNFKQTLPG